MGHIVHGKKYYMGVPQGSFQGSLLFNISLFYLFYFLHYTDIASYVDDTTPCNADLSQKLLINELEET